jgi:hypothetical protein
MMESSALRQAIEIVHVPSQVRLVRSAPLPDGVLLLLRIAAGEEDAEAEASRLSDRPPEVVHRAAIFFIEQILLNPDADCYRVLGVSPEAGTNELRRNMALLLKWLHPDLDRNAARSALAKRVTMAWDSLKTPERRAAYDAHRRSGSKPAAGSPSRRSDRVKASKRAYSTTRSDRADLLRRGLSMLLGRPWR